MIPNPLPDFLLHELPEVGKEVTGNSIQQETSSTSQRKWAGSQQPEAVSSLLLPLYCIWSVLSCTNCLSLSFLSTALFWGMAGESKHSVFISLLETEDRKAWVSLCLSCLLIQLKEKALIISFYEEAARDAHPLGSVSCVFSGLFSLFSIQACSQQCHGTISGR